jgi:outer membrane lipoprotein carrier protein
MGTFAYKLGSDARTQEHFKMRHYLRIIVFMVVALSYLGPAIAAERKAVDIETILSGIEQRYAGQGFSAKFFQESFLKAMQISDTAEGHLTVKRPGRMRWEYVLPEKQTIITDGKSLWIYRPDDNQVMVGKAPEFFKGGKGATFLSDIRQLRKSFSIQLQPPESADYHRLRLVPKKASPELVDVVLSVSQSNFQVDQVITHNRYGDETLIVLNNYQFNLNPKDALFQFQVPQGVDVVQIDQP